MPILAAKGVEQKAWLKGRSKYPTGFCNEHGKPGQHEGQKPKSFSGKALPTCEAWDSCPCACHWNVDQMFKMTGLERKLIPNPEYAPPVNQFVMPDVTDNPLPDAAGDDGGVIPPPTLQQPAAANVALPTTPLAVRRTETGRAARGGLEAQVWDACANSGAELLTPKVVGEWIAEKYTIPTPSSGAINAVWDRWTKLGYCEQAKKPNRFLKFTGDGTWEELVRMKGSVKRQQKSAQAAMKLGRR